MMLGLSGSSTYSCADASAKITKWASTAQRPSTPLSSPQLMTRLHQTVILKSTWYFYLLHCHKAVTVHEDHPELHHDDDIIITTFIKVLIRARVPKTLSFPHPSLLTSDPSLVIDPHSHMQLHAPVWRPLPESSRLKDANTTSIRLVLTYWSTNSSNELGKKLLIQLRHRIDQHSLLLLLLHTFQLQKG